MYFVLPISAFGIVAVVERCVLEEVKFVQTDDERLQSRLGIDRG